MSRKRLTLVGACAMSVLAASADADDGFPVTIDNCGQPERIDRPAMRAVANDVNNIETVLTLGVQDRMAGYSGLNRKDVTPALQARLAGVPALARQYPSLEMLLSVQADFYVAGWGYGMRVGTPLTPDALARYGIHSYLIRESCIRVGKRVGVSIDDMFEDVRAIGRAFGVATRAETLIDGFRQRLDAVQAALAGTTERPRVFVYDSGDDAPLTAGQYAMPTALIAAAGARNVMDDVGSSWTRVDWESVVQRDPELIVINDYGAVSAADKIAFLEGLPALAGMTAVRARRFIVLGYDALTPGVRNIDAVEALARAAHPGRF